MIPSAKRLTPATRKSFSLRNWSILYKKSPIIAVTSRKLKPNAFNKSETTFMAILKPPPSMFVPHFKITNKPLKVDTNWSACSPTPSIDSDML